MSEDSRLGWYARRLRAMGAAELAWRVRRVGTRRVRMLLPTREPDDRSLLAVPPDWPTLLARFRAAEGRPLFLSQRRASAIAAREPAATARVLVAAAAARERRFTFFGYPEFRFAETIDWASAGPGGGTWPRRPSHHIDYRSETADPKWVWELNRLQHLVWLAQAWLLEGDETAAEAALAQLDGWVEQSPPGRGIAWHGGFEPGIRAISIALALQGLRDAPALTPERYRRAVRALAQMARRAWGERSLHSSANNHLLGELTGLLAVAVMFPELREARDWERRAVRGLAREAARQTHPDGMNVEQAFAYQVFSGDLLIVAAALLRGSGRAIPVGLSAALDRSAGFMAGVLGDEDPAPRYGDDDDGFAVRFGADRSRDPRGHLGAVAALTAHAGARRAGHLDLEARWLLGEDGERAYATARPAPEAGSFVAPVGGLVVLRSGRRRVTLDVGPLGYRSIAAHGHADALTVTVADAGSELIGDPGPASYFGHPDRRRVHRGTAVHATLTVDDQDQSVSGGPFLWSAHAACRLLHADVASRWAVGEHDGYRRLADPVRHRRWVLAPGDGPVLVLDMIEAAADHLLATAWPLHPDVEAEEGEEREGLYRFARAGAPVGALAQAAANADLVPYAVRGDAESGRGWWSDRLEQRRPSWLVGGRARAHGPELIATVIWTGDRHPAPIRVAREGGRAIIEWHEGGARRLELDLDRPHMAPRPGAAAG